MSFLDATEPAVVFVDATAAMIVGASLSAANTLGYQRDEMRGLPAAEVFPANGEKDAASTSPSNVRLCRHKDGSQICYRTSTISMESPVAVDCINLLAPVTQPPSSVPLYIRESQQRALVDVCKEALSGSSLTTLCGRAVESLSASTGAVLVAFVEFAHPSNEAVVRAEIANAGAATCMALTKSEWQNLREYLESDNNSTSELTGANIPLSWRDACMGSLFVVPIRGETRPMGTLILAFNQWRTLSESESDFFGAIAATLAAAIARKQAELTQARLVSILEATPDFVGITDPHGHPIYVNKAGRKMLGIVSPNDPTASLRTQWVDRMIDHNADLENAKEVVWRGETVIETTNGKEIPVSQVIISHRNPDGTVDCLSTIARDISEQQALQKQLNQAHKMEAIGRLAGGVAHDFNNLLTGIRGYSDLLLADEDQPERRKDLCQIRELADRASDLTRQLLAFSRQQPIIPTIVDINRLVSNTSRMLQRLIGEHIQLEHHTDLELGNARVDPGQIEQILMNLVVNARDAMPDGGKLLIETKNIRFDEKSIDFCTAIEPGDYIMIAVADTGHGMDEATRQRIFEPFFTTKKVGQGTGLGLATVYGIVKQHDGHIWVYSEPGMGSTFKIYLPRVHADLPDAKMEDPATGEGSETILVVEDEDSVREVIRRILSQRGYTVWTARNLKEALTALQEASGAIRLVLTDVVLPDHRGPDIFYQLHQRDNRLRVLYMSGHTDESIVRHGVLNTGTPFIQKPFESQALARKLRDVLDS